jgi:lipid-A-disaccharide synthase
MSDGPLFFLVAGEASGDFLGSALMRSLRNKTGGTAQFAGVGGPRMEAEGLVSLFPQSDLTHMGIIEVIRHTPLLLKRIRQTVAAARQLKPAAVITIDAPDFCFRVAKRLKGLGFPLIHYVAPTVWAWRRGRAKAIASFLDHLLALFPFEPPYFTREGLSCTFVGHPLVESEIGHGDAKSFRTRFEIQANAPLLCVLPGSRVGEVRRLLPIFQQAVELIVLKIKDLRVVIPMAPNVKQLVEAQVHSWKVPVILVESDQNKYDAFAASQLALACSGTVALELALAKCPSIIAYKANIFTAFLLRRLATVRYANLVNIMHNRLVVPELLQENCTASKLAQAMQMSLLDQATQIHDLRAVVEWLGHGRFVPSDRAAETVLNIIHRS